MGGFGAWGACSKHCIEQYSPPPPSPGPPTGPLLAPYPAPTLGPLLLPLHVRTRCGVLSRMRLARESAEKPPNTTLWTAPMRAHASCTHAHRHRHTQCTR